jgi:hypothetical protein
MYSALHNCVAYPGLFQTLSQNGLDIERIHEDKDSAIFITIGVKVSVARRFVNVIREWVEQL